jgi:signal transduction histidine kinase
MVRFLEENKDYQVMQERNGNLAFDIAKEEQPDLIITDWEMPEVNGIEFIKMLKKDPDTCQIPVIMATSIMTTPGHLEIAFAAGAVDFIRSPVQKTELKARVNSMLKLSESDKKNRELNAMKDRMITIISHDLRSPFNSLIGFSNLLIDQPEDYDEERRDSMLKIINKTAKDTLEFLNNLLDWTHTQTGKHKPIKTCFPVISLIDNIVNQHIPIALNKAINISFNKKNEWNAYADFNMVNTILRNLVSNAVKFTPKEGNISIDYECKDNFIHFHVTDSGIGIPIENQRNLYSLDKKVLTKGTTGERGSGLGLVLCKEYVEMNGGKLFFESEEGKGSKFSFTIPLHEGNSN